ncbi:MAG: hypothetical protein V3T86_08660 [Planctomycetota bacterium]
MKTAHDILALIHVPLGFAALTLFWVAISSRKGGRVHLASGRWFARAVYGICASAVLMSLATLQDPLGIAAPGRTLTPVQATAIVDASRASSFFLMFLTLVSLATTRHGVMVVRTRRDPYAIRTPAHIGLSVVTLLSGFGMVVYALALPGSNAGLFYAMSPLGFIVGGINLHHLARPAREPRAWFFEHIGAMIGGGIAVHTAFLVLGLNRLVDLGLSGGAAFIPWVAPTILGLPAIFFFSRHYRKKFAGVGGREGPPA